VTRSTFGKSAVEGVDAMSEENKTLAVRMPLEVFVQGKLDVVDEVLAPGFTDHAPALPGQPPGREGVKIFAAAVRQAFPDLDITINHAIAEGDLVALHITAPGTMQGEFVGLTRIADARN
jgi:predicted SnoaL-like aldol condensation-catalyzing enzyme